MLLRNKNTGMALELSLRAFQSTDAPQVIACIQDAYGDSYVKSAFYDAAYIIEKDTCGELLFSVAETPDGTIAGITACLLSPHYPGQCEIACQVIRREFSGYGLALPLALHAMNRAGHLPICSQFAKALGCHLISQKTLKGMGFTPCGFVLNVFDKEKFLHHFQNGNYAKIPQSIAVKRQGKTSAGAIYMPEELLPLADAMYQGLALPWSVRQEFTPLSGEDLWDREEDTTHSTLSLWARTCGADFDGRLSRELAAVENRPDQTVNLYLNLSCSGSGAAYAAARQKGFFFTGFLPCAADGEYMILHHPLNVPVQLDGTPHIPEYAPFMAPIRRQI